MSIRSRRGVERPAPLVVVARRQLLYSILPRRSRTHMEAIVNFRCTAAEAVAQPSRRGGACPNWIALMAEIQRCGSCAELIARERLNCRGVG